MPVIGAIGLLALVKKVTDWTKQITNKDWNGVITQIYAWLAGFVTIWLAAQATHLGAGTVIGDTIIGKLSMGDLVLSGLFIGSGGSLVHDFLQAHDNTNTSTVGMLRLIPGMRSGAPIASPIPPPTDTVTGVLAEPAPAHTTRRPPPDPSRPSR